MDRTEIIQERIAAKMMELTRDRGAEKTICPSEVARAVAVKESAWRDLMPYVRAVAVSLSHRGMIQIEQEGTVLQIEYPEDIEGPIRLRLIPQAEN
jgi:hypothetical protein